MAEDPTADGDALAAEGSDGRSGRRTFIKRSAAAVTIAWAVPTVVSARAAAQSAPPRDGTVITGGTVTTGGTTGGGGTTGPTASARIARPPSVLPEGPYTFVSESSWTPAGATVTYSWESDTPSQVVELAQDPLFPDHWTVQLTHLATATNMVTITLNIEVVDNAQVATDSDSVIIVITP